MKTNSPDKQIQLILDDLVDAYKKARKYLFSNISKSNFSTQDQRSGDCTTALDPAVYEIYFNPIVKKYNMVLICEESNPYNRQIDIKGKDYLLIIDPIDGTKNMMSGLPFGVNIAFGKLPTAENFTIGNIQCVFVANYLTMKSFIWTQGCNGRIIPAKYPDNLEWGHFPGSCNIFEVPDSKSYIEPDYPEGERRQNILLNALYQYYNEAYKATNIQRRAIDTTGLRILEIADNNLFAYGDIRRATRIWDSIPSIKYILETRKDYIIFDSSYSRYNNETVLLRINSDSNYTLDDYVGKEFVIIPKVDFEKFKNLYSYKQVFIVHGRDKTYTNEIARFIDNKFGIKSILFEEELNRSQTIIEKLLTYSYVQAAIVIITPDDEGRLKGSTEKAKPRARQNVIFEMGLFYGILGRENVIALLKDVEKPSDIDGVLYIKLDDSDSWKYYLQNELDRILLKDKI